MKTLALETVCLLTVAFFSSGFWWFKSDSSRLDAKKAEAAVETTGKKAEAGQADVSSPASTNPAAAELFQHASDALLKADQARDQGNLKDAVRLYEDAYGLYTRIAREHPDWESSVVKFRTAYCDVRVRELLKALGMERVAPPSPPPATPPASTLPPPTPPLTSAPTPRPVAPPAPLSPINELAAAARECLQKGNPTEARNKLIQGLKLNPDDEQIRLLLGVAQCQAGNHSDAQMVLQSLLDDQPTNAWARVALGAAQFGSGRIEEARQSLESALKLDPALHEAHFNLAQVRLALKPPDKVAARQHYDAALKLGAQPDKKLEKALN